MFAILTVCVPNSPKSTSFVSPTLYLLVFPDFTLAAIVAQLSLSKDTGVGIFSPNVSLSTALNSNLHVYSSVTLSVATLSSVTVNVPFTELFADTFVASLSSLFLILVYFAVVPSFGTHVTVTFAS
ncbi:unknown [Firmicutes bacterium CAG:582]|nr:unknown [Firmicutes bacterium CAG:582]